MVTFMQTQLFCRRLSAVLVVGFAATGCAFLDDFDSFRVEDAAVDVSVMDACVPVQESCNGIDEDCDGVPDNGTGLCGETGMCINGQCEYECPFAMISCEMDRSACETPVSAESCGCNETQCSESLVCDGEQCVAPSLKGVSVMRAVSSSAGGQRAVQDGPLLRFQSGSVLRLVYSDTEEVTVEDYQQNNTRGSLRLPFRTLDSQSARDISLVNAQNNELVTRFAVHGASAEGCGDSRTCLRIAHAGTYENRFAISVESSLNRFSYDQAGQRRVAEFYDDPATIATEDIAKKKLWLVMGTFSDTGAIQVDDVKSIRSKDGEIGADVDSMGLDFAADGTLGVAFRVEGEYVIDDDPGLPSASLSVKFLYLARDETTKTYTALSLFGNDSLAATGRGSFSLTNHAAYFAYESSAVLNAGPVVAGGTAGEPVLVRLIESPTNQRYGMVEWATELYDGNAPTENSLPPTVIAHENPLEDEVVFVFSTGGVVIGTETIPPATAWAGSVNPDDGSVNFLSSFQRWSGRPSLLLAENGDLIVAAGSTDPAASGSLVVGEYPSSSEVEMPLDGSGVGLFAAAFAPTPSGLFLRWTTGSGYGGVEPSGNSISGPTLALSEGQLYFGGKLVGDLEQHAGAMNQRLYEADAMTEETVLLSVSVPNVQ